MNYCDEIDMLRERFKFCEGPGAALGQHFDAGRLFAIAEALAARLERIETAAKAVFAARTMLGFMPPIPMIPQAEMDALEAALADEPPAVHIGRTPQSVLDAAKVLGCMSPADEPCDVCGTKVSGEESALPSGVLVDAAGKYCKAICADRDAGAGLAIPWICADCGESCKRYELQCPKCDGREVLTHDYLPPKCGEKGKSDEQ